MVCYVVRIAVVEQVKSVPRSGTGRQSADWTAPSTLWSGRIQRQTTAGVAKVSPARPKEPIPGARTLSHHPGPSLENFQSSPRKSSIETTEATPPPHPKTTCREEKRARGSSAQLPGSPWCRARCRRAPWEGQPVEGVERPNGSLRFADIIAVKLAPALSHNPGSPAPRVLQGARTTKQAVGQPQPWRRRRPRPSTTASRNCGSA